MGNGTGSASDSAKDTLKRTIEEQEADKQVNEFVQAYDARENGDVEVWKEWCRCIVKNYRKFYNFSDASPDGATDTENAVNREINKQIMKLALIAELDKVSKTIEAKLQATKPDVQRLNAVLVRAERISNELESIIERSTA
jgi:hypothetical protein